MAASSDAFAPPNLVFVHCPKTGGTSVTTWLQRHYPIAEILNEATVWPELNRVTPEIMAQKCLVRGHFGRAILGLFGPDRGFQAVTVLRDPVQRVLSHFWHLKRAPDTEVGLEFCRDDHFTLRDFLEHPATRVYASNCQTTWCGAPTEVTRAFLEDYREPDFAAACAFLDQCAVVGVTEDLPGFLSDLSATFGFSPDTRLLTERRYSPRDSAVTPDLLEQIRALNTLDQELYAYARARATASRNVRAPVPARNPNRLGRDRALRWRAGAPYWGHGWTDVQSPEHQPHVWSVVPEATLEFETAGGVGPWAVTLTVRRFVLDAQALQFTVSANGEPLPLQRISPDGQEPIVYVGCLGAVHADRLVLTFRVAALLSFRSVWAKDTSDEPRGMALSEVRLIPATA